MTKKFSWEADKASLTLRVTDGAKETTWKLRKNMSYHDNTVAIMQILETLLTDNAPMTVGRAEYRPMTETVRTVDAEELAELQRGWEDQSHVSTNAVTEEGSKEALNARVTQLSKNAQWWDTEDDVYMTDVPIPDYDAGEV